MFRLTKWYLDAVGEDGTAFIGYAAHLNWGALRVRCRASLLALPNGSVAEAFTLRASPDPLVEEGGVVRWSCLPLQLQGVWTPRCAPVRRAIFTSTEGDVVWECLAPAATVNLTLRSLRLAASGYVDGAALGFGTRPAALGTIHIRRFQHCVAGLARPWCATRRSMERRGDAGRRHPRTPHCVDAGQPA